MRQELRAGAWRGLRHGLRASRGRARRGRPGGCTGASDHSPGLALGPCENDTEGWQVSGAGAPRGAGSGESPTPPAGCRVDAGPGPPAWCRLLTGTEPLRRPSRARSRPRDGARCGRWRGGRARLPSSAGTASGGLCASVSGTGSISRAPASQLATVPLGPESATECARTAAICHSEEGAEPGRERQRSTSGGPPCRGCRGPG